MDYIKEIFNKHYSESITTSLRDGTLYDSRKRLTLFDFRAAVKDIEADHLKRVCETE